MTNFSLPLSMFLSNFCRIICVELCVRLVDSWYMVCIYKNLSTSFRNLRKTTCTWRLILHRAVPCHICETISFHVQNILKRVRRLRDMARLVSRVSVFFWFPLRSFECIIRILYRFVDVWSLIHIIHVDVLPSYGFYSKLHKSAIYIFGILLDWLQR